ncbi:outer membrane protein [Mesorhizobium sp. ArgA1]
MKAILLAAAFLLVPAGTASAADADATLPVAATYNWSGAYVGAQAGYAWGDARVGQTFAPGAFDDYGWGYDPSGGFGALYAGFNHQFDGGLVLGIEGDYSFASVKDTTVYQALGVDDPGFGGVIELQSVGSVRLRAGYAMDRWLPFVAAGLAVANYKHTTVFLPSEVPYADVVDTLTGYTLGAGLEYAVSDNWLIRGEYRFADLGHHKSTRHAFSDGTPLHDEIELKTNDIRIGIAYKF